MVFLALGRTGPGEFPRQGGFPCCGAKVVARLSVCCPLPGRRGGRTSSPGDSLSGSFSLLSNIILFKGENN